MQPPLAPGSWHAVAIYATLHHFPEPERLLEAAARLLLPGGFVAADAQGLGLDKPDWVVEIQMKDRSKHVLSVGSEEKDGFRGLTRKGFADIFSFRQYALDRFLLDPKDYK